MQTLTRKQLEEKMESNDNAVLIDVLSTEQYKQQHIPGAINIPKDAPDFIQQVQNMTSNKTQDVIVYCAGKSCNTSEMAAEKLIQAGFSNVQDFTGGIEEWKQSGCSVKAGDKAGTFGKKSGSCGTSSCS